MYTVNQGCLPWFTHMCPRSVPLAKLTVKKELNIEWFSNYNIVELHVARFNDRVMFCGCFYNHQLSTLHLLDMRIIASELSIAHLIG